MTRKKSTPAPGTRGPGLLTVPEVAERLRRSVRTVWRWIKDGSLPVHRFGRGVLVSEDDLERFIAVHRHGRGGLANQDMP